MAQIPIREYDAKRLREKRSGTAYTGVLIENEEQLAGVVEVLANPPLTHQPSPQPSTLEGHQGPIGRGSRYRVVKPDQLFGKRGKLGLVGVKLDAQGVQQWIQEHRQKEASITLSNSSLLGGEITDTLDTFLIEPFVPHQEEYYISISTERDADVLRFSALGGVDIEEQWESVREVRVGVLNELDEEMIDVLLQKTPLLHTQDLPLSREKIRLFIKDFFQFFRAQGFTSLEVNPFVISSPRPLGEGLGVREGEYDQLQVSCLDMVAKVDSCEAYRQKERSKYITRVKPFGSKAHPSEMLVEELDAKTGASLKLTIINPDGRLRFLLGGGGASVIVMDSLTQRGLMHELANYGELSGNPDEDSNRSYVTTLIETLLANGKKDQYLCLLGGIANFTDIVALVKPLTDVLSAYAAQLREQRVTILMRRGGLRVEQAMQLLEKTCKELGISCVVLDDEQPLTQILEEMRF